MLIIAARAHRPFWLILIVYLILASLYSVATPIFEASDELWHYPMVKYIADNGFTLPVQNPASPDAHRQEGSQPPLYYLLSAALTAGIDTRDMDQVRYLNPHPDLGVMRPDGNVNIAIHDPAKESFPWRGTVLAVHIARFFSVILGALTVCMAYMLALELFPDQGIIALGAATFTAFNPMFLFISGSVNNDNLSTALASVLLVQIVRLLKRQDAPPIRDLIGIGIVAGCGMLAKFNIGFMLPMVAFALAIVAARRPHPSNSPLRQQRGEDRSADSPSLNSERGAGGEVTFRYSFRQFILGGVVTGGLTLLISAWWYLRNWSIYGDPTGLNVFLKIVGEREIPANLPQLWSERHTSLMSYWGFFGGVNVPFPDAVYTAFNAVAAVSVAGLIAGIFTSPSVSLSVYREGGSSAPSQKISNRLRSMTKRLLIFKTSPLDSPSLLAERGSGGEVNLVLGRALTLLWIVILFLSLIRWTQSTWASQGRLMFAAIAPLSLWMAVGLWTLGSGIPRVRWRLLVYSAAGFLIVAATTPLLIARTYSDPGFNAGVPSGASVSTLQLGTFAEPEPSTNAIRVGLCCDLPKSAHPGQYVTFDLIFGTIGWRPSQTEWSAFIHLVNRDGLIVAQRDVLLKQGLGSTRLLNIAAPGEQWRNRFAIQLPDHAYTPDSLRVMLGFSNAANPNQRMEIISAIEPFSIENNMMYLGTIQLVPRDSVVASPNPTQVNFGDEIDLIGYEASSLVMTPGSEVSVTLYWRARRRLSTDYSAFVHVFNPATTEIFGGADGLPSPSSGWVPGEVVTDTHTFKIRDDAPPGTWQIEIGVYDYAGGQFKRLRIVTPDGGQANNFLLLSRVKIGVKP